MELEVRKIARVVVAIVAALAPSMWFGAFTEGFFVSYGLFVLGMVDGHFLMASDE